MQRTIYIATTGSHGDVHPFLAIGRRLRERGHRVVVSVHPFFRHDVEAAGLEHTPIGEQINFAAVLRDPLIMHPWRGGRAVMNMVINAVPAALRSHRAALEQLRPDVIVAHPICLGLRWVAEDLRIPTAYCTLAPMIWFSRSDPVPLIQRHQSPVEARLARWALGPLMTVAAYFSNQEMNRLRVKCGYAPVKDAFWREFHGGAVNLGMWSPHMRGPTDDDPPHGRICGFPWYDRSDRAPELPAAVERFLQAGPPPVIFSLGTAAVYVPGDFYHVAAEACRLSARRGLLLVGPGEHVPRDLPPSVLAVDYLPFSLVLPRGCCTVHHGGIGSTGQALRSGRPAVVVPHSHDQFHNGLHARRLGVATTLPRRRMTVKRLVAALEEVLTPEANAAAAALREKILPEDGTGVACSHVERLFLSS